MGARRKFSPEEKAQIVLEILKEEKSISQLASEHEIHANVLNRWKNEAIQNFSQLFVDDRKGITKMKNDYEQQINELYAEVGKLSSGKWKSSCCCQKIRTPLQCRPTLDERCRCWKVRGFQYGCGR